nr:MAG TPA: hypothetical protein [Caudoviricetes sp.]
MVINTKPTGIIFDYIISQCSAFSKTKPFICDIQITSDCATRFI